MTMHDAGGHVQTVRGPVPVAELGYTHTHEHVLVDLSRNAPIARMTMEERRHFDDKITLENYYRVRRDHRNRADLIMDDEAVATRELTLFKEAGGGAIVDATSIGLGRDPTALARVSRASGVHIILGSGYYVAPYHPPEVANRDTAAIEREIIHDVAEGVDGAGIRAGIIGEIGLTWPVHPDEDKVLRAACRAQAATGVPLLIHPGRNTAAPLDHIRVVREAGGDVERTVMSHIDRTLFDLDDMKALADTGCSLEFDLFGQESSHYALADIDMPNDATRVDYLMSLMAAGYERQLVIAQDICHNTHLVTFGGEGYAHILKHVVPLMRRKGMSTEKIDLLLTGNPARILERRQ